MMTHYKHNASKKRSFRRKLIAYITMKLLKCIERGIMDQKIYLNTKLNNMYDLFLLVVVVIGLLTKKKNIYRFKYKRET